MALRKAMWHQERALDYGRERNHVALFVQMRLGKCLIAIRWAREKKLRKVLIVAPLSTIPGWMNELEAENERQVFLLRGTRHDRWNDATKKQRGWFLINYEGLRASPELISNKIWDGVIVDESTKIKNPTSKTTKAMTYGFDMVPCKAILSGLPNPESELDYVSQLIWLQGQFMGYDNFWKFREENYNQIGYDWVPKPGVRSRMKEYVKSVAFFMTRKEAKVGSEFKPYETRFITHASTEWRKTVKQVKKDFETAKGQTKYVVAKETWLQRLAGGFAPSDPVGAEPGKLISDAKFKELMYLLTGELKKEQVVVWFRFNQELNHAYKLLKKAGIPVSVIHGGVDMAEREVRRRKFQKGARRVLLVQIKCGRMGMDMSAADTAIYFSVTYSYEDFEQTKDRLVHVTKDTPLLLIFLAAKGFVDEAAIEALTEKGMNAKLFNGRLVQILREQWQEKGGKAA